MVDFRKEVDQRKDDLLKDLFTLLSIDSVRDDSQATADAPVGPGPKEALLSFLEMAERDGFVTKNVDNLAGHAEFGTGDETLGVFAHVDVVPVGSGWNTDPFKPEIIDGKLYARGSSDDKGPLMAGYYALKIIKELGLETSKKVRFIVGTDEESGWKCMDRYLEVEPKPDFGFSPDAEFPIINGEKGIVSLNLHFKGEQPAAVTYQLVRFEAGLRENMVPQDAVAVLTAPADQTIEADLAAYVADLPVTASCEVQGNQVTIKLVGKAAHAMEPRGGENAGTYLATFLNAYDFGGAAKHYLAVTANYLHQDSRGEKLGIAYTDEKMGDLTMNPGVFSFDAENGGMIVLNFRFPKGVNVVDLEAKFIELLGGAFGVEIDRGKHQEPHYVPADDPLVKTLLDVYEKHTGQKGQEKSIGGGTYGRLLERGVAYGALFPEAQDTMHQANEFMVVEDILRSAAIYAEAIYELIK